MPDSRNYLPTETPAQPGVNALAEVRCSPYSPGWADLMTHFVCRGPGQGQ